MKKLRQYDINCSGPKLETRKNDGTTNNQTQPKCLFHQQTFVLMRELSLRPCVSPGAQTTALNGPSNMVNRDRTAINIISRNK